LRIAWTSRARRDREAIRLFVQAENPAAAITLDQRISQRVGSLRENPSPGRSGRIAGTREPVVHPNYLILYDLSADTIRILRILHAARRWPP
jgi:toxin ParE1/3/4